MTNVSEDTTTPSSVRSIENDNSEPVAAGLGTAMSVDFPEKDGLDDMGAVDTNKRFSQGTLLLILVSAIAAAGLYTLRTAQSGLELSELGQDIDAQIDMALTKHTGSTNRGEVNVGSLAENTDSIVAMFAADLHQHQIPIRLVKKNPFELVGLESDSLATTASPIARKDDGQRLAQLGDEAKGLNLQTVLKGRTRMAIINGELVTTGHTIGSFTVKMIGSRRVELQNAETTFILLMEDGG